MTSHDRMRAAVEKHALTEGELVAQWLGTRPPSEEERVRFHVRQFLEGHACTVGLACAIIDLIVDQQQATRQ